MVKLFRTSNTEIIAECQRYFGFSLLSKLIEKRIKFVNNYNNPLSFSFILIVYRVLEAFSLNATLIFTLIIIIIIMCHYSKDWLRL